MKINKAWYYVGGIGGFIIAYSVGRYYPGIILQLIIAYALYWLGKKIVKKYFSASTSKDKPRKKFVYVLSGLGLLGILSPILGFIFALPAYLIATQLITHENKSKKKLVYVSGIVLILCLLNAAWGVATHQ